jgi:hypothetical protein
MWTKICHRHIEKLHKDWQWNLQFVNRNIAKKHWTIFSQKHKTHGLKHAINTWDHCTKTSNGNKNVKLRNIESYHTNIKTWPQTCHKHNSSNLFFNWNYKKVALV